MSYKNLASIFLFVFICLVNSSGIGNRKQFLHDFLLSTNKPNAICSYLELDKGNVTTEDSLTLYKATSDIGTQWQVSRNCYSKNFYHDHFILFLMDLSRNSSEVFLEWASQDKTTFRNPKRWMFFYNVNNSNSTKAENEISAKYAVENLLGRIYMRVDTEIQIVLEMDDVFKLFLIYRINTTSPVIWEHLGSWSRQNGLTMVPKDKVLSLRRRNLHGAEVVAIQIVVDDKIYKELENYENAAEQTITKLMYYMMKHLFEWVNATSRVTTTDSGGERVADGRYTGVFGAMINESVDFGGSILIPKSERVGAMCFVTSPGRLLAKFIFKKPVLASVTNIYTLPFSTGVWISFLVLMLVLTFALFLAYFQEQRINMLYRLSTAQRVSEAFLETFCLVFQQGTACDPISVACRQILILGLMTFMFLFTAYSANVVALLQSASNDINSIETLMASPYACGAQDVQYARMSFSVEFWDIQTETRPEFRAFVKRKLTPLGESMYLDIPDGIRRVREGMFAFHVETTAGYDEIQKTFMEDEKCNLGAIKYMPMAEPYFAVAASTHIKEQLRIGGHRIIESGVQSRSKRRLLRTPPHCGAGSAVFTAVRLSDVTPAFTCLLIFYAITLILLGLEIYVHRRTKRRSMIEAQ